jgi:hypothetical protein
LLWSSTRSIVLVIPTCLLHQQDFFCAEVLVQQLIDPPVVICQLFLLVTKRRLKSSEASRPKEYCILPPCGKRCPTPESSVHISYYHAIPSFIKFMHILFRLFQVSTLQGVHTIVRGNVQKIRRSSLWKNRHRPVSRSCYEI